MAESEDAFVSGACEWTKRFAKNVNFEHFEKKPSFLREVSTLPPHISSESMLGTIFRVFATRDPAIVCSFFGVFNVPRSKCASYAISVTELGLIAGLCHTLWASTLTRV